MYIVVSPSPNFNYVFSSYDHLARLLHKILDERPENAVDVFEDMSREVKRGLMHDKQGALRDTPFSSAQQDLADLQRILFARPPSDDGDHDEELVRTAVTFLCI